MDDDVEHHDDDRGRRDGRQALAEDSAECLQCRSPSPSAEMDTLFVKITAARTARLSLGRDFDNTQRVQ